MKKRGCAQCKQKLPLCGNCLRCDEHCRCVPYGNMFDADELGLDPETDNTPKTGSRHA